jgi:hypothetical protein
MISIRINEDQYATVLRALRNIQRSDRSVLKTSVNNAAVKTQKNLASKAAKIYSGEAGKRSTILSTSSIKKGVAANPTAIITFGSEVRDVDKYKVRIGKRGISVSVRNDGFKKLSQGFVAKLPWQAKDGRSGVKEAIVSRIPGVNADIYKGKPSKPHYEKIRKILSPSVGKQIKNKDVYNNDEVAQTLSEEVNKVLEKVLKGGK